MISKHPWALAQLVPYSISPGSHNHPSQLTPPTPHPPQQQYTFIHYAVLEALVYGDTSYRLGNFSSNYQDLQEINKDTGRSLVEEEFLRLGTVRTMVKKSSFLQKVMPKLQIGNHQGSEFLPQLVCRIMYTVYVCFCLSGWL